MKSNFIVFAGSLIRLCIAVILFQWAMLSSAGAVDTLGDLQASPGWIPSGQQTAVIFTVSIPKAGYIKNSAVLQEVDAKENVLRTLGSLHDDGKDGDPTAHDGIFTLRVPLTPKNPDELSFRVSAAYRGQVNRVTSWSVYVQAKVGVIVPAATATLYPGKILFRNSNGAITKTIQLKSTITDDPVTKVRTLYADQPTISASGRCAAVYTEQSALSNADGFEGDGAELELVRVRYFCAGRERWTQDAEEGWNMFWSPIYTLLSANGERVLLVETPQSAPGDPKLRVLNENGDTVFERGDDLTYVSDAAISSHGRFAYMEGSSREGETIMFIDIDKGTVWKQPWEPYKYNGLRAEENEAGSYNLVGGDKVIFRVPISE